jgi:bis(5'-adenosyl)-triphosphatase
MLERVYSASALNIAIQDGEDAGQSVPHVHAHVIPRVKDDLSKPDAVYGLLEGRAGDLEKGFRERDRGESEKEVRSGDGGESKRGKFPAVDADEDRKPRSAEEMEREAQWFAREMERQHELETGLDLASHSNSKF